ncbi:MAG: DNA methyltransferase [Promethearchaeota archaeon]
MKPSGQPTNSNSSSNVVTIQWQNVLINGNVFYILPSLESMLKEKTKFKLIFMDLPVFTTDENFELLFPEKSAYFKKRNGYSMLKSGDLKEYLRILRMLFQLTKNYLTNDGFLAVKVNGIESNLVKIVLDQVFGPSHFVNEIILNSPFIWENKTQNLRIRTNKMFLYSSAETPRINPVFNEKESGGYWHTFMSDGQGRSKVFTFNGEKKVIAPPPGTHWKLSQQKINEKCKAGEIRLNRRGQPEYWIPRMKGHIVGNNWLDISSFEKNSWGYMENSENFLERLIKLCSSEGDIIGDFFCQFGMGAIVAERLNRFWVGIEIAEPNVSFIVQRLQEVSASYKYHKAGNIKESFNIIPEITLSDTRLFTSLFEGTIDPKQSLKKEGLLPLKFIENHKFLRQETVTQTLLTEFIPTTVEQNISKKAWKNKLIKGDNIYALRVLTEYFQKSIQTIYIDPPFFTGTNSSITIPILENDPNPIEDIAYQNIWKDPDNLLSFMKWFEERALLMRELLRDDGFIFVRFDYHYGHYAKQVLDNVFGQENFCIEFLVRRMIKNLSKKQMYRQRHLIVQFDSLFLYQKSRDGKLIGQVKKIKRKRGDSIEIEEVNDNIWVDISGYQKTKQTLYPSENSEKLLERVIKLSTKEGDIVADFFCGSGTTLAVAEKLKRRWIGIDIGKFAIHETRKRILRILKNKPFQVYQINGISNYNDVSNDTSSFKVVVEIRGQRVKITLVDYEINTESLKSNKFQNIRSFSDLIDYWAIDWSYNNEVFHNHWYSFREFTRRRVKRGVKLEAEYKYPQSGNYKIFIKLIDIQGNEITKLITASIPM